MRVTRALWFAWAWVALSGTVPTLVRADSSVVVLGVRSLDGSHPERSARNYWRGPVWANITWLAALGLHLHGEERAARTLVERMLLAAEGDGVREYYSPESGRGLGARDFSWTAALCLRART